MILLDCHLFTGIVRRRPTAYCHSPYTQFQIINGYGNGVCEPQRFTIELSTGTLQIMHKRFLRFAYSFLFLFFFNWAIFYIHKLKRPICCQYSLVFTTFDLVGFVFLIFVGKIEACCRNNDLYFGLYCFQRRRQQTKRFCSVVAREWCSFNSIIMLNQPIIIHIWTSTELDRLWTVAIFRILIENRRGLHFQCLEHRFFKHFNIRFDSFSK